MKKLILLTAAVLLAATTAFSQEMDARNKVQVGVKVGINSSNVYDEDASDFRAESKRGFAGGVFFAIPFGDLIGIQPAVMFSQKGFKATGTILFADYEFKRTKNFIDVPLLLTVKPSQFITFLAGPQYSYLLSQKDVFEGGTITYETQQDFENNNLRKNIFGVAAGFDITIQHFVLSGRASWDLLHNDGDGTATNPRYKNVCLQGTIGYRLY